MQKIEKAEVARFFAGKSVAIVGSGPGCLDNDPGLVDAHQIVVRVNNFKTGPAQGYRCDCFYSFFGGSIKKTREELIADGVKLCMSKLPDAKVLDSAWHKKNNKPNGVDFRYVYRNRRDWWFVPTYVPPVEEFMAVFHMLGDHIPSTGFSAILAVKSCDPASVYLTGFDFFASRVHNVSEPWRPGNPDDPIGHAPERERAWLAAHSEGFSMDKRLTEIMAR